MMVARNSFNSSVVLDRKNQKSTVAPIVRKVFMRGPVSLKETRKGYLNGTGQFLK
jgi:hypothetical protein